MAYSNTPYPQTVSRAEPDTRAEFIRKTYSHLAGALLVFAGICGLLLQTPLALSMTKLMVGSQFSWLITLGLFMGVSWIANKWAMSDTSVGMQYVGLGVYTVAEAVITVPLLYFASVQFGSEIIQQAALMTAVLFGGLTSVVFITRKDFSFLGPILSICGFVAMGVIVASFFFGGFSLGILFSGLMVLFAGGAILYDTSNIMLHYRTDQHVAASLSLFASVVLLFWYILRLLMSMRR